MEIYIKREHDIAQMVEHMISNHNVPGSTPGINLGITGRISCGAFHIFKRGTKWK